LRDFRAALEFDLQLRVKVTFSNDPQKVIRQRLQIIYDPFVFAQRFVTFFTAGSKVGIQAKHEARLNFILALLDQARRIEDMNAPGLRLHQLKGKQSSFWSVTVQANWRMIFKFEDGNAYVVDYLDYH